MAAEQDGSARADARRERGDQDVDKQPPGAAGSP
jgi:hypothetical protein